MNKRKRQRDRELKLAEYLILATEPTILQSLEFRTCKMPCDPYPPVTCAWWSK